MSVDSPDPRQRTVAELLAANGGSQTGRRRRRRAAEDGDDAGAPQPGPGRVAPEAPAGPATARGPATAERVRPPAPANGWAGDGAPHDDRPGPAEHPSFPSRRPEPAEARGGANGRPWDAGAPPNGAPPNGAPPNGHGTQAFAPNGRPGPAAAPNGRPRYGADGPYGREGADEVPTSRLDARRPAGPDGGRPAGPDRGGPAVPDRGGPAGPDRGGPAVPDRGGPPTQFGAPPLEDHDGGPPTQFGAPPLQDGGPPTGAYDPFADGEDDDGPGQPGGDRTAVLAPDRPRPGDYPDEYDELDHDELDHDEFEDGAVGDGPVEDGAEPPAGLDDAASTGAAGTGQAWAVVIAQWIGGAVAGAAIWVLFRYLWFSLPIVALSLAVVLTVGLVLGVRALLRNDDLKTTLFAVLVGLLLTVSPAILVLLDR